jgi:FKBP-type peptidyl-prolyl cis-trans isomerase
MAHDVFISHSSKDKIVADAVCALLEEHNIRCWVAPRDITPGKEWGEAIVEAISASRVMVLIFSASANGSPQIRREVERAVNKEVVVVPLRIEDVLPTKSLEYFIGSVHWLDALTQPLEVHLKKLIRVVEGVLGTDDSATMRRAKDAINSTLPAPAIPDESTVSRQAEMVAPVQSLDFATPTRTESQPLFTPPESNILTPLELQDSKAKAAPPPALQTPKQEASPPSPVPSPSFGPRLTYERSVPVAAQARGGKQRWRFLASALALLFIVFVMLYMFRKPSANVQTVTTLSPPISAPVATQKPAEPPPSDGKASVAGNVNEKEGAPIALAATAKRPEEPNLKKTEALVLRTTKDKVSYAYGMNMQGRAGKTGDLDPDIVEQAVRDELFGRQRRLTNKEMQTVLTALQNETNKTQAENIPAARFQQDELSYAIGMRVGKGLRTLSIDVDLNIMMRGLRDAKKGGKTLLTEDDAKNLQNSAVYTAYDKPSKSGSAFLAANRAKAGVVTLPSGLQYKILTEGTGPRPTLTDTVVFNYRETLINGMVVDSGKSVTSPGSIKGLLEGFPLMPVGSRWRFFIPSELAFGKDGDNMDVGPAATVIFDIDLISIQK